MSDTERNPDFSRYIFVLSGTALIFIIGLFCGTYKFFPYWQFKNALDAAQQVFHERETLLGIRPSEFLAPSRYGGSQVTKNIEGKAVPGLTLLVGFFEGNNELRLVKMDGTPVRRWPVKFSELFPNSEHIEPTKNRPNSDWNAAVHGSLIQPDGSVVFNFTYMGSVKLDRCGKVLWTLPLMTHHAVEPAEGGGFWIPNAHYRPTGLNYPVLQAPYRDDTILKVSDDGKVLQELSVLDVLYANDLEGMIYARRITDDILHLNDVEELDTRRAAAFPQFAPGDLMISMRMNHAVVVFDPKTSVVKWFQVAPWIGQHDPDFLVNGLISVYSNNDDGTLAGSTLGGSTIIDIDPKTQRTQVRYGGVPGEPFFAPSRGKHQHLGAAEQNNLIVEPAGGRVFEITPTKEIVWEYVNRFDEKDAAVITTAARYPEDYFTTKDWSCPQ
jgi:Arylsulfotransferase (ASST)